MIDLGMKQRPREKVLNPGCLSLWPVGDGKINDRKNKISVIDIANG
jgi:hypothetical protein